MVLYMHSKEVGIPFPIESKIKSKYEILESNVLKTLEQKRNKLPLKIEDKLWIYNDNLINRVTFAKKHMID